MSLLKKASIITTPTAYAEDFLYNIKPAGGLGDELVTNGTFDTDSNWNKTGTWTISNNSATADADSTSQYLQQDFTITNGKIYEFNYVILQNTLNGNGAALSSTGGFGTVAISNEIGQHKTFITATNSSAAYVLKIGVSSTCTTGTIIIDNVSVKEVVDFSFDRNSTGTRVNEDYLIEDVPYNIVPQSNQFDTTWTKTNVTLTGGQSGYYNISDAWKIDISSAFAQVEQAVSTSGVQTFSVYAKAGTLNFIRLRVDHTSFSGTYFDLQNGVIGSTVDTTNTSMQNVGGGWYRCSISFVNNITRVRIYPATANNDLTATSGNIFIQNAQLVKGDKPKDYLKTTDRLDIPRIDYTNGEPSILLEPQSTNKLFDSNYQDIKSSGVAGFWLKASSTSITSNSVVGVYGLQSAATFTYNGGASSEYLYGYQIPVTSGNTYTVSGYVKLGTASNFVIVINNTISWNTVSGANYVATKDNGHSIWKRFTITFTAPSTNKVNVHLGYNQETGVVNQAEGSVFLDAFQLEELGYATSIIPTSGSAVTRSQDAANNAGNSDLFNDSEGVLYAELKVIDTDSANKMITLSNGTNSTRLLIRYVGTTLLAQLRISGSNQYEFAYTPSNITDNLKIAIKYKVNDFSFYVNGTQLNSNNSGNVFSSNTLTELAFDDGGGSNIFNGNVKSVMVFKEALTDLELEKLTGYNNHELYMNYYNRLSYLGLVEEYNVESDINNYIL